MIIAKVMKMIIIFMLIIAVIPEHYIMPFVPLCEKLKMNSPPPPPLHYGNTWTCSKFYPPPSEVRVMSDTGEFSKTFDGIFVVGLGMPYKTRRKKWCSYDEFTWVDLFGSVLKMTSGLFVCCGAKNYGHSSEVYHTTLKKKKKKKKKKQKLTDFSLLPPPSLFFLSFFSFLSFPLSPPPPPIPATPFLILLITNRGRKREKKKKEKKRQKKKNKNKQTNRKNRALHWACPSVWPLLCFVCISFFNLSHCIPYHNTCWYCFI